MPQQRLTIVHVTLYSEFEDCSVANPDTLTPNPICTIKTGNAVNSFFNGADERIIQTAIRKLKN